MIESTSASASLQNRSANCTAWTPGYRWCQPNADTGGLSLPMTRSAACRAGNSYCNDDEDRASCLAACEAYGKSGCCNYRAWRATATGGEDGCHFHEADMDWQSPGAQGDNYAAICTADTGNQMADVCEARGRLVIETTSECDAAAKALVLSDTTARENNPPDYNDGIPHSRLMPYGCVIYRNALYVNLDPRARQRGDRLSLADSRQQICQARHPITVTGEADPIELDTWTHLALVLNRGEFGGGFRKNEEGEIEAAPGGGMLSLYVNQRRAGAWPMRALGTIDVMRGLWTGGATHGAQEAYQQLAHPFIWEEAREPGRLGTCSEPSDLEDPEVGWAVHGPAMLAALDAGAWRNWAAAPGVGVVTDAPPCAARPPRAPILYCHAYDAEQSVRLSYAVEGPPGLPKPPAMFWYAPSAPRYVDRDVAMTQARLEDVTQEVPDPREADLSIVVYRAPVNQPPTIVAETTQLVVQEDGPGWLKFVVTDPDAEESLEHMLSLTLDCQHGHLRSLAVATALRSQGGKKILFRGTLTRINAFLEQVEYWPDPNYHGVDTLIAVIDDHGFTSVGVSRDLDNILTPGLQDSTTVPVVVVPVHDAPVLVCPSSVVTFEDKSAIIGTEIMYKDVDQIDVAADGSVPARLEMSVSGGGLNLDLTGITLQAHAEFPAPSLIVHHEALPAVVERGGTIPV